MKRISNSLSFLFNNYAYCLYILKYLKSTYSKCWLLLTIFDFVGSNIHPFFYLLYHTIYKTIWRTPPNCFLSNTLLADFFESSWDGWGHYSPSVQVLFLCYTNPCKKQTSKHACWWSVFMLFTMKYRGNEPIFASDTFAARKETSTGGARRKAGKRV